MVRLTSEVDVKLTAGQVEQLAVMAHDAYLARLPPSDASRSNDGTRQAWEDLDETKKTQNRDQVRRQERWLDAHQFAIVESGDTRPLVSPEDLELLIDEYGQYEHAGWMDLMDAAGWVFGEERDDSQKTHPCFVPWSDLPEDEKEKDRAPLRELSNHLAPLGLRLARS